MLNSSSVSKIVLTIGCYTNKKTVAIVHQQSSHLFAIASFLPWRSTCKFVHKLSMKLPRPLKKKIVSSLRRPWRMESPSKTWTHRKNAICHFKMLFEAECLSSLLSKRSTVVLTRIVQKKWLPVRPEHELSAVSMVRIAMFKESSRALRCHSVPFCTRCPAYPAAFQWTSHPEDFPCSAPAPGLSQTRPAHRKRMKQATCKYSIFLFCFVASVRMELGQGFAKVWWMVKAK